MYRPPQRVALGPQGELRVDASSCHQCSTLIPVQDRQQNDCHQRTYFKETMYVLLGWRDAPPGLRVRDIPDSCGFVCHEGAECRQEDPSVDLKEEAQHGRGPRFGQHEQVNQ